VIVTYADLHRERPENRQRFPRLTPPRDAIVLLAGDIAYPKDAVTWAAETFPDQPVGLILGNHEPYRSTVEYALEACRKLAAGTHVRVLARDRWDIAGVRILGCTLWTDYDLYGEAQRPMAMRACDSELNDAKMITDPYGRPFRASAARAHHVEDRRWLTRELARAHADGVPAVVLTHHAPTPLGLQPHHRRSGDLVNAGFASNLEAMMDGPSAPIAWAFGHTHAIVADTIYDTRIVSNALGYLHKREGAEFDPGGALVLPP
jgi:hypothetical protein